MNDINVDCPKKGRELSKRYSQFYFNKFNRRRYVNGALYTKLFTCCSNVIVPEIGRSIELHIHNLDDDSISILSIYKEQDNKHPFFHELNNLSSKLSQFVGNTCRKKLNDKGKMILIGYGKTKSKGKIVQYKISRENDDIRKIQDRILHLGEKYYQEIGLSYLIKNMRQKSKEINDQYDFVTSIVQSTNLINSAHIDIGDATESIATWTELKYDFHRNWFFILPNTSVDKKKVQQFNYLME